MTDCIDATKCRTCGRTALFDGVELKRVGPVSGVTQWECETPCLPKTKKTKVRKNRVRNGRLWTNPLLERLSSQLSLMSVSLEYGGEPGKGLPPSHHAYDLMIPLVCARRNEPLGWVLFWAKYLSSEWAIAQLQTHVVRELPSHKYIAGLGHLVVACYCTGAQVSERNIRRALDIGRGSHLKYHLANELVLCNLNAIEANYAWWVRMYL